MARKPRRPGDGSDKAERKKTPQEPALSRRAFLGYGGAALTVLALPLSTGCGEPEFAATGFFLDIGGLQPRFSIDVVRPEDLLVLNFAFVNLDRNTTNPQQIVRTGTPALVVVTFQSQHIFERAFPERTSTGPSAAPVASRIANKSHVVFVVPDGVNTIPYKLSELLDRCRTWAMNVHANAAPRDGVPANGEGVGTTSGSQGPKVAPAALETSIELPYRLRISPNAYGRWAHSLAPVVANGRTELWHTRLGSYRPAAQRGPGDLVADERNPPLRTARALWTRDHDSNADNDEPVGATAALTAADRRDIVDASGNFAQGPRVPMEVELLMLSALGGWLKAESQYPPGLPGGLAHWFHRASMGRDYYVEVARRGFLFPFGHKALLINLTERKTQPRSQIAPLWKRQFIVVKEPIRRYAGTGPGNERQMPFVSIEFKTLVTPNLDPRSDGTEHPDYERFIPRADDRYFHFEVEGVDRRGQKVRFWPIVMFLPESQGQIDGATMLDSINADYRGSGEADNDLGGQRVTLAEFSHRSDGTPRDDTTFELQKMELKGSFAPRTGPEQPNFTAVMRDAAVVVEAVRAVAGVQNAEKTPVGPYTTAKDERVAGAPRLTWSPQFVAGGFGATNPRELFLQLTDLTKPIRIDFSRQADKAGGFLTPNLSFEGLSRVAGPVNDVLNHAAELDPKNLFPDPANSSTAFDALLPRIFGCIKLRDIIKKSPFQAVAPRFVTEALDDVERIYATLLALKSDAEELQRRLDGAAGAARDIVTQTQQLLGGADDTLAKVRRAVGDLRNGDSDTARTQITSATTKLEEFRKRLLRPDVSPATAKIPGSDAFVRTAVRASGQLVELLGTITTVLAAYRRGQQLVRDRVVNFEWRPPIQDWSPFSSGGPLFKVNPNGGLVLSSQMRLQDAGGRKAGVDLVCSLEDFSLLLIPTFEAIRINFQRLQFRQTSGRKPEIDVVLGGIEFLGCLGFINTLKDIIPLDGFSDPPNVKIGPEGLEAGFSLALPSIGVGIFSLENIAIGAALKVPFLGDALTLQFNFCTRENPFLLTVSLLGGGGFAAVTLSPEGIQSLEISLEFGASLSINLGVASGSVSIMAGIYFGITRKPDPSAPTTKTINSIDLCGFLRIRGCVDVLGLISASIELRMELHYYPVEKKVIGRASLEIEISIAFFSTSVKIETERRFAGDNDDPTLAQTMGSAHEAEGERSANYSRPLLAEPEPWKAYWTSFDPSFLQAA